MTPRPNSTAAVAGRATDARSFAYELAVLEELPLLPDIGIPHSNPGGIDGKHSLLLDPVADPAADANSICAAIRFGVGC